MVLDLIETAQMSKRVDLFYLLDSLLQVDSIGMSQQSPLPGVCLRLFPSVHRLTSCSL